jgi:AraC-like DNA-binding protein
MEVANERLRHTLSGDIDNFSAFAGDIGGILHADGEFYLPAQKGSGGVKELRLEQGAVLRACDFTLNDRRLISRKVRPLAADPHFTFIFILTPDHFVLKTINEHRQFTVHGMYTVLLASDNTELSFEVAAGHEVKALSFSMPVSRFNAHLQKGAQSRKTYVNEMLRKHEPFLLQQAYTEAEFAPVIRMHADVFAGSSDARILQSEIYYLAESFLFKVFSEKPQNIPSVSNAYFEKMMHVEQILIKHLGSHLPPIHVIARQMALSESTLKRYFKAVFGKTVYDYYLSKKMEFAKCLLVENDITVNDTADKVGYEKVSSFIATFKKYMNVLPGSLKRSKRFH